MVTTNTWHIITSEYPPDVGGVSDYTQVLAQALVKSGDEVHVWCAGAGREPLPGVHIHSELGRIGPADLRRMDTHLSAHPGPRRLLVQWVPHGFGYRSMNVLFCAWLLRRAGLGDRVELMVHEPCVAFAWWPLHHVVIALAHRLMNVLLLRAASRVWYSIPAWEAYLRPYALGREVPMGWLPIPACVPVEGERGDAARTRYAGGPGLLVGHFGTYGPAVAGLLEAWLPAIMAAPGQPSLLLIGAGSKEFHARVVARRPEWARRVSPVGWVTPAETSTLLATCDLFVQPYPDGVSTRRTTVMACLSLCRPVITTHGRLTEPLWRDTGAVCLTSIGDQESFDAHLRRLLNDPAARLALGARGLAVYDERFAIRHVVAMLRAA